MQDFIYQAFPARVLFGVGRISDLPAEIERLDVAAAMVIFTG